MKLYLENDELMKLLREALPKELIDGYVVTDIESEGYPVREYKISFEKIAEKEKVE